MKVSELIAILEDCDPEAEVLLATRPNDPREFSVEGVTVREEMLDGSERDGDDSGPSIEDGDGARGNDVLLIEGEQLRFGDRDAWAHPRTEA